MGRRIKKKHWSNEETIVLLQEAIDMLIFRYIDEKKTLKQGGKWLCKWSIMGAATTTYSTYTVRIAIPDSEIWYVHYVKKGQFGPTQHPQK